MSKALHCLAPSNSPASCTPRPPITVLPSHWPPSCSYNAPHMLSSKQLWTCCTLFLECSFPVTCLTHSFPPSFLKFRFSLRPLLATVFEMTPLYGFIPLFYTNFLLALVTIMTISSTCFCLVFPLLEGKPHEGKDFVCFVQFCIPSA